ncbi:MAG: ASKHA domain-containing protein [Thermoproteota archaeon]
MPVVTVQPEGVRIKVPHGSDLLTALRNVGVNVESVCGGRGVCKKCIVEIVSGSVSEPSSAETGIDFQQGIRLACQTKVLGDTVVKVPQASRQTKGKILEEGVASGFDLSPAVKLVNVRLEPPSLKDQRSDMERLLESVEVASIDSLLLKRLPSRLRELGWELEAIVRDDEVLDVRPRSNRDLYGVAVDVGTTTVVVYLVSLKNGRIASVKSDYNGQIAHGDDVISRITYAVKGYDNLKNLQNKIVETINRLVRAALDDAGCASSDVYEAIFSGNTVMLSLLYGAEVSAIASAPYVPPFRSSLCFKAREIGLEANSSAVACTLPVVSGYVGGDVVADIMVSGMHKCDENSMLIDLGTNGEVVLKSGELMLAASTAAGPAIEGAGLSNGMRGMEGAIESVSIDVETYDVYFKTIGGKDPRGICGSGVVDSIAWMLIAGVLDQRGRIIDLDIPRIVKTNDAKAFTLAVNSDGRRICVTQSDVRVFQLAKAAVFSACLLLLKKAGLVPRDLSKIYIAGAFGNYVDPRSAMVVGMIPEFPLEKIVQIGNGSGHGAMMSLLSKKARGEAELIARKIRVVDLNTVREFQSEFIDSTLFPHRRREMFPKVIDAIGRRIPLLG